MTKAHHETPLRSWVECGSATLRDFVCTTSSRYACFARDLDMRHAMPGRLTRVNALIWQDLQACVNTCQLFEFPGLPARLPGGDGWREIPN